MSLRFRALLIVSLVVGCSPPVTMDDGGSFDAGRVDDAGVRDAGLISDSGVPDGGVSIDAGLAADAGTSDAGSADAGAPSDDAGMISDAGEVDAGETSDAGVTTDAGLSDAGLRDAGVTTDAGLSDAGPRDAGVTDAGLSDAGPRDAGPLSLQLTLDLHRDGGAIIAELFARDGRDAGRGGLPVQLIAGGVSRTVTDLGAGRYVSNVMPATPSGEVRFVASVPTFDAGVSRTAVVLPIIDPQWDQPEAIGGLVNTPGTEDSSTISPDGQWLIVGTYSPVDVLSCHLGFGAGPADGRNSACQTSLGPISGPARPRMPGASRIVSPTRIIQNAPSLCVTAPDGGDVELPLPDGGTFVLNLSPVTAYGFRRQPDGTFAEPFVLQFASDGVGVPFCFTFLGAPTTQNVATLLYANRPINQTTDAIRPWLAQSTLGADVTLGAYSCVSSTATFSPNATFPVPVSPITQQAGNTSVANGFLVSDDESASPSFTIGSRALPDGGFEAWQPMELPETGDDRRQPVLENGRIFYYRNATISSTPWLSPGLTRASFGAPRVELQPEPLTAGLLGVPVGRIVGIGQPTFAHLPDGTVELYFVYYLRTATGFDSQIARVRRR